MDFRFFASNQYYTSSETEYRSRKTDVSGRLVLRHDYKLDILFTGILVSLNKE